MKRAGSSTEFESDDSDSDEEEEQLSSEFLAIPVVQQADALLNRLAARLACADRRERASTRRASVALSTNIRELKADSTVISYADGVGRVSHRGRLVSDELCHVRGQEYSLKVRRNTARACYRSSIPPFSFVSLFFFFLQVRRNKAGEKLGLVLAFDNRPASERSDMPWHPPIVVELEPGAIDHPRGAAWSSLTTPRGGAAASALSSVPSLRPGDHLLSVNGRRASATKYTSARSLFAPATELELSLLLSRPAAPAAESGSEDEDEEAEGETPVPRRLAGALWKQSGFVYRKREYVLDGGVLT
jgi:hypothetical protein